jgi:hypothetical protein
MQDSKKYDNEIFIDADAGFINESNSFEIVIVKQIQKCVEVLSREMTGGQVIHKTGPGGSTEKYVEDVRELVINHVDTLRMLMSTFIEGDNKKALNKTLTDIDDYKKELLQRKTIIPGRGLVKLEDIKNIHVDSPVWKEFIHYKAVKYRDVFEILVNAYNKSKADIRALEEE